MVWRQRWQLGLRLGKALMPATACPNSRIAAVICSGVRTRAAGDDGAGAEGAIAPEDASAPNVGALICGSSADVDTGGSGWT